MSSEAAVRSPEPPSGQSTKSDNSPCEIQNGFTSGGTSYALQRELASCLTDSEYARVCDILVRNVATQRAERVMAQYFAGTADRWQKYQLRVIDTFYTEHAFYDALQQHSVDVWRALADQLTHTAQSLLLRNRVCLQYARDQAAEMSQQACERVFSAAYPWDIPFHLWANTILRNIFLQRYTRSHDLMDRQALIGDDLELDETYEYTNSMLQVSPVVNPMVGHRQSLVNADDLIDAIEQMQSEQRRAVILYTYYEEFSDEEIAQALGKTRSAVHTLRHRALRQLRAFLGL